MLLQSQTVVEASHNEVHTFGSEPCRLFSVGFGHCVSGWGFYNSIVILTSVWTVLPYMGLYAYACQLRAHNTVPVSSPALLRRRCAALLSASRIAARCSNGSNKVLFFLQVNEEKLTLVTVPKEANTRQELIAFQFPGQQKENNSVWIYLRHFLNMSTWAALTAKLLLKDSPVPMLHGRVEQSET